MVWCAIPAVGTLQSILPSADLHQGCNFSQGCAPRAQLQSSQGPKSTSEVGKKGQNFHLLSCKAKQRTPNIFSTSLCIPSVCSQTKCLLADFNFCVQGAILILRLNIRSYQADHCGMQVSIDGFIMASTFCDVATLSDLTQTTAGQLYHYYPYCAPVHNDQLANDLRWNIMRPQVLAPKELSQCLQWQQTLFGLQTHS